MYRCSNYIYTTQAYNINRINIYTSELEIRPTHVTYMSPLFAQHHLYVLFGFEATISLFRNPGFRSQLNNWLSTTAYFQKESDYIVTLICSINLPRSSLSRNCKISIYKNKKNIIITTDNNLCVCANKSFTFAFYFLAFTKLCAIKFYNLHSANK